MSVGVWRTARKEHVCDQCEQTIAPGTRYWEYQGASPAFQSGDPYCAGCATLVWAVVDVPDAASAAQGKQGEDRP